MFEGTNIFFFTKLESLVAREGIRIRAKSLSARVEALMVLTATNKTCGVFSSIRLGVCDSSMRCSCVAPGHMVYRRCPRDSPRRGSARLGWEK